MWLLVVVSSYAVTIVQVKVSSDMWLVVVVSSYAVTIVQVLHSINQYC